MAGAGDEQATGNGADQDRHEGSALHQRVAGGEFADRELVRQHRVFHRAEQGGDDAEQAEGYEQQRNRMQEEAAGGEGGGENLGELQPSCDDRFDVFVGKLAAEAGQDEKRKDEDGARDRHQRIAVARYGAVEQDDDERVLEDVIVECRAELGPEQRREAA